MAPLRQTFLGATPSAQPRPSDQNSDPQYLIVPVHLNTPRSASGVPLADNALTDLNLHRDAQDLEGDRSVEPRSLLHDIASQLDIGIESDQGTTVAFPRFSEQQSALTFTNSAEGPMMLSGKEGHGGHARSRPFRLFFTCEWIISSMCHCIIVYMFVKSLLSSPSKRIGREEYGAKSENRKPYLHTPEVVMELTDAASQV
ncbi:uncharacterized protein PV07_10641 [Cladophialophora immunda]|uniref:Uncharacterized protein n=1 Tax=Cladophialophora immunda TaxID=569365 RepID=A0A0D2C3F4_9EURO|nr:uncharacterized protein PV07_10641 [Cladophialophora immunda]KIW24965.1 hypothetical protein PV07_10641 [Cladophialophora immunda]